MGTVVFFFSVVLEQFQAPLNLMIVLRSNTTKARSACAAKYRPVSACSHAGASQGEILPLLKETLSRSGALGSAFNPRLCRSRSRNLLMRANLSGPGTLRSLSKPPRCASVPVAPFSILPGTAYPGLMMTPCPPRVRVEFLPDLAAALGVTVLRRLLLIL